MKYFSKIFRERSEFNLLTQQNSQIFVPLIETNNKNFLRCNIFSEVYVKIYPEVAGIMRGTY